ncbi:hypothetical protein M0805_001737 [Coniferiporia weirii]|nr:hypothetical protein M0805_001737 [Coniferiporia weirii]
MSLYGQASGSRLPPPVITTEFDILKASHRFLREDDGDAEAGGSKALSWNDQVAKKYYDNLFREFAVCDLKHYKSGNFALRWRTETEVLAGTGETTCGNTRCARHTFVDPDASLPLVTVELPFAYEEHGTNKEALVKVVLCGACLQKLMWKREKEKAREKKREVEPEESREGPAGEDGRPAKVEHRVKSRGAGIDDGSGLEGKMRYDRSQDASNSRRRRNSRSISPVSGRKHKHARKHRHRSPTK